MAFAVCGRGGSGPASEPSSEAARLGCSRRSFLRIASTGLERTGDAAAVLLEDAVARGREGWSKFSMPCGTGSCSAGDSVRRVVRSGAVAGSRTPGVSTNALVSAVAGVVLSLFARGVAGDGEKGRLAPLLSLAGRFIEPVRDRPLAVLTDSGAAFLSAPWLRRSRCKDIDSRPALSGTLPSMRGMSMTERGR